MDEEVGVQVRREKGEDGWDEGALLPGCSAVEEVVDGACDDHNGRGWEELGVPGDVLCNVVRLGSCPGEEEDEVRILEVHCGIGV